MTDPFLAEVMLRAWGTDDPRVLDPLQHENDRTRTHRAETIEDRARTAGWPSAGTDRSRKAGTDAVRRLEGVDVQWNGTQFHDLFRVAAYESRSRSRAGMVTTTRGGVLPVDDADAGGYDRDDSPTTIFDE